MFKHLNVYDITGEDGISTSVVEEVPFIWEVDCKESGFVIVEEPDLDFYDLTLYQFNETGTVGTTTYTQNEILRWFPLLVRSTGAKMQSGGLIMFQQRFLDPAGEYIYRYAPHEITVNEPNNFQVFVNTNLLDGETAHIKVGIGIVGDSTDQWYNDSYGKKELVWLRAGIINCIHFNEIKSTIGGTEYYPFSIPDGSKCLPEGDIFHLSGKLYKSIQISNSFCDNPGRTTSPISRLRYRGIYKYGIWKNLNNIYGDGLRLIEGNPTVFNYAGIGMLLKTNQDQVRLFHSLFASQVVSEGKDDELLCNDFPSATLGGNLPEVGLQKTLGRVDYFVNGNFKGYVDVTSSTGVWEHVLFMSREYDEYQRDTSNATVYISGTAYNFGSGIDTVLSAGSESVHFVYGNESGRALCAPGITAYAIGHYNIEELRFYYIGHSSVWAFYEWYNYNNPSYAEII